MTEALYPCPSCGFLIFEDPPGNYDICSLCGWEDDAVQLASPGLRGGANGGSLKEYQDAALREYPAEVTEVGGRVRDPKWRPLRPEECVPPESGNGTGVAYFHAVLSAAPEYYWILTP